jgi:hypothetical protein
MNGETASSSENPPMHPIGHRVYETIRSRPGFQSVKNVAESIGVNQKVFNDFVTGRRDITFATFWRYAVWLRLTSEELSLIFRPPSGAYDEQYLVAKRKTGGDLTMYRKKRPGPKPGMNTRPSSVQRIRNEGEERKDPSPSKDSGEVL